MDSRRDFLKKAALLSGAAGLSGIFPPAIQKAMAINPAVGSTFLDAEHVVILMQENRSFDHCFGTLRGVRGFGDPRAIDLPNGNKVWLQTNAKGDTYAPFRLNIKDTKATWMGSLPHGWTDQTDARNGGKYDQWLEAKKSGHKEYKDMPLTLGYYNREDLSFYYSMADAFTVCDQNFCSSLTGTTPNRSYLWTGTIRENAGTPARVRNSELDYGVEASWKTFPERLEENNISWKIYQNEISVGVGFEGEEDAWLANFTDNPIEWFSQYHVKFHPAYIKFLPKKIEWLTKEIKNLEDKIKSASETPEEQAKSKQKLIRYQSELKTSIEDQKVYTPENYAKLSPREKNIHEKAFTTNINDPHYHELTTLKYKEGNEEREVLVPKGDVLHQFRDDVKNNKLPTVSWLVAPENFSDHPGAPWYGAWYVSEAMDILTQNPEVWKKTIFILCYDENDGYFDHVPPFVAPDPAKPETGLTSKSINSNTEFVTLAQDTKNKPAKDAREGSIGLGYRVPLVIASPWSRGGVVNSQVFDHTSILQLMEKILSHKTGKKIEESNISAWRRAVCGDLTSVFQPYNGEKIETAEKLNKDEFIEDIHQAKFKKDPSGFKALSPQEITEAIRSPLTSSILTKQEKGIRPSSALPYQLYAHGKLSDDKKSFRIEMQSRKEAFKERTSGSPFIVYGNANANPRSYAVVAGDQLEDSWKITDFNNSEYNLKVNGPNGFYRQFRGNASDPAVDILCEYAKDGKQLNGNIELIISNKGNTTHRFEIRDNAYKSPAITNKVKSGSKTSTVLNLTSNHQWYDFSVFIIGSDSFEQRFAGRVETGKNGFSDPLIGQG